ncbi:amidohydrolase family protein [Bosea sp. TND4EK4]|uniref:amidohydrolase family protein n=1 Tax=Bosea sp. TND4EK4 TaxID=1907408 RepID=UPI0009542CF6|nr:amidohydrolase family protein [Bosea sp. TND4EK4]SIR21579.1 Cytosine/adenosine deaminase [Bosea sp. TND4EK4]
MPVTLIKNADIVVAWDAEKACHVYLHGADVAFEDGTLRFVGKSYEGHADDTVDGAGRMVMPGLVNIHSHPSSEALNKGFLDELGSPALYNSSLYEFMPILRPDAQAVPDCVQVAYSELLLSGVTTLADLSVAHPQWLDLAAQSGLRVCISPMFRSARWFTKNGYIVEYEWDEKAAETAMAQAFDLIAQAQAHPSGRLSGMVCPAQIDTCSEGLIKESHAEAKRRGLPWQIHAAQSTVEFHEITRRHGVSPIQWLERLGVLGDTSIIGHGIFLDDYARVAWHSRRDLDLLAETGTMVAHCPTVFLRRGIALDDFGRYRRAGVRIGLGTDTYPHNMLEEMRHVGYVARLMAENPRTLTTTDIFEAATTAGAAALGRDDIGRLEAGCKADLVLVDLDHPMMQPRRDPVRSMIYAAAERAVDRVYVDGTLVVADGEVLTMDYPAAARRLTEAQKRTEAAAPKNDWAGRAVTEYSPLTFPQG